MKYVRRVGGSIEEMFFAFGFRESHNREESLNELPIDILLCW